MKGRSAQAGTPSLLVHVVTNLERASGAERSLVRLATVQGDGPVEVISLMSVGVPLREELEAAGVTVRALGGTGVLRMSMAVWRLRRELQRLRPDVVMSWMIHANLASSLALFGSGPRARLYWNIRHSLDDPGSLKCKTRSIIRLSRPFASRTAGIVYVAARSRAQHEALAGFPADRGIVIPNGYRMPPMRDPTAFRGTAPVVGMVARYHVLKDPELCVRAFAAMARRRPDLRFRLAGRGMQDDNEELLVIIASSGLDRARVELLGEVPEPDEVYATLRLLLLTSRTEGFPNVIAEAMSHGVPCVTSDVGDAAHIVGTCGTVVEERDPERFAEAALAVLALDDDAYARLSARARERIRTRFGMEGVVQAYGQLLG